MLKVSNLSKKYKDSDVYSLKDVSFELSKGEIVGLIGKNGAGKTTLMKMITKTILPSAGEIYLEDENVFSGDNRLNDVGILIDPPFYPQLTVIENLNFYLEVNRLQQYKENIQNVLELVDLWDKKNKKPSSFSFGMKQRLSLAMCLVSEPSFAIMDEPFVGLDPIGVADLIGALKKWVSNREMTILISSHQLAELDELCDRFMYIESGKLVKSFDKNQSQAQTLIIELHENMVAADILTDFDVHNNIVEISGEDARINTLFSHLSKLNSIKSISCKVDDQLKEYFVEEEK